MTLEKDHLKRIALVMRPVDETWQTLPQEDQDAWASFFNGYVRNVLKITDAASAKSIGGGVAQLWAMAHEYHRLYGFLWD